MRLVESISRLAVSKGAAGFAEGIERSEQEACLIEVGWHLGQGFLYGQAVPFGKAREITCLGALRLGSVCTSEQYGPLSLMFWS